MRIAFLSPTFPPNRCGVGDHSFHFASELSGRGEIVRVWTAEPKPITSHFTVSLIPRPWSRKSRAEIKKQMSEFRPDLLVVQYTPQLIAPDRLGVDPSFPFWIAAIRSELKCRVAVIAHEINYPVELSWRGFALGLPQVAQFGLLATNADHVFCSTQRALKELKRFLPSHSGLSFLPVGATVIQDKAENHSSDRRRGLLAKNGIEENGKILFHFGGAHPTHHYPYVLEALRAARKRFSNVTLVCVGVDEKGLKENLNFYKALSSTPLPPNLLLFQNLNESEVSDWIKASDLVLAPFMDGISTRRSSAMASLQHGKAVVTNFGKSTDREHHWENFCAIRTASTQEDFANQVVELLSDPTKIEELGIAARRYYYQNFDWSIISDRFLQTLLHKSSLAS